jgi:hypothetical protein
LGLSQAKQNDPPAGPHYGGTEAARDSSPRSVNGYVYASASRPLVQNLLHTIARMKDCRFCTKKFCDLEPLPIPINNRDVRVPPRMCDLQEKNALNAGAKYCDARVSIRLRHTQQVDRVGQRLGQNGTNIRYVLWAPRDSTHGHAHILGEYAG